jgi:hypothetical protein
MVTEIEIATALCCGGECSASISGLCHRSDYRTETGRIVALLERKGVLHHEPRKAGTERGEAAGAT